MDGYAAPTGVLGGIMATAACLGGFALMLAVGVAIAARASAREKKELLRASRMTCAELGRVRELPDRCVVHGRIVPGPRGEVVAPLSGRRCAWYLVTVQRLSSTYINGVTEQRLDRAARVAGGEPFWLADPTGAVRVSGDLFDTPGRRSPVHGYLVGDEPIEATVNERSGSQWTIGPALRRLIDGGMVDADLGWRSSTTAVRVAEFVVAAGVEATVFGAPRREAGQVVLTRPDRDGAGAISRRRPDELLRVRSREPKGWSKGLVTLLLFALVCAGITAAILVTSRG